ncbi:hypothetical protein ACO0SA_004177 [Hanseniaspora valbyensis]
MTNSNQNETNTHNIDNDKTNNSKTDKNYQKVLQYFMDNIVNINLNKELDDKILIFLAQMKHYVINARETGNDNFPSKLQKKHSNTFTSKSSLNELNKKNDLEIDDLIKDLIEKIEHDDKNSNYTRHLFALKKLTDYMQKDILENQKKNQPENIDTKFYDKATLSLIDKNCYDKFENINFYKAFTSYNHWQLKNMIKIDPVDGNICFVNKDRIFELNTDSKKPKITLAANTNQLLKTFDINENFIVSCGVDQDRVFERSCTIFDDEKDDIVEELENYSTYTPGTNIRETHNGIVSITNRSNTKTVEVKLGRVLNNDIAILPSNNSSGDNELQMMTVNNDGFLYKLSVTNNQTHAEKINLINKSLNTIDISPDGKIAGVSTDESYSILLDTRNLNKQLKTIIPGPDTFSSSAATIPNSEDFQYNLTKLDKITPPSSGRYGFGTKFSPCNNNEFTTIFQNGLIQFYDIRNMDKPLKEFACSGNTMGGQVRGVCYDSKGKFYVSQESGVVHCFDPKIDSQTHEIINLPCVVPFRGYNDTTIPKVNKLAYMKKMIKMKKMTKMNVKNYHDPLYTKEVMPFVSTADDVVSLYRWFDERVGVISSNRYFSSFCKNVTVGMNKRFGYSFFDGIKPNQIPSFNRLVSLERSPLSPALEKTKTNLLSEHEEAYLESMTWQLPRNTCIEQMRQAKRHLLEIVDEIEDSYSDLFEDISLNENSCYADLVPFDKLVAKDVQSLKLSKIQEVYLDVIEKDQRLSHFYNNSEMIKQKTKGIKIHEPKVLFANGQELSVSDGTTLASEFLETKQPEFNLLDYDCHDDIRMPFYEPEKRLHTNLDKPYTDFIIDEYKKVDYTMNPDYIPKITADNGITGLSVRIVDNTEELVIGVGTGIYTIPIYK